MTPGEVLSWTKNVKLLTSTKHKCALMRIAHGDVYTNARLFRFGLIDNPKCANCDTISEDIEHRFITCNKARIAWQTLEGYIGRLGLPTIDTLNLEAILGAGGNCQLKLALTLRAELTARLMTKGGQVYCPIGLAKASIRTILMVEKLNPDQKLILEAAINQRTN